MSKNIQCTVNLNKIFLNIEKYSMETHGDSYEQYFKKNYKK